MFLIDDKTPPHIVQLTVNNQIHEGWTDCTVELNLDALSGAFALTVTEDWVKKNKKMSLKINEGDACSLALDGATVITGWVDKVTPSYSSTAHSIKVEGRDKTGDLVDCSAPITDWHGRKLEQIAVDICNPYGIAVICKVDTGAAFGKFSPNPGDTCGATIERLLRQRGLWAYSDGLGNLIIDSPKVGEVIASFSPGNAVVEGSCCYDMTQRFSDYHVLGQHNPGGEDDEDDSEEPEPRHPEGRAKDPQVKRYRPMVIVAEAAGQGPSFVTRAAFEARVRAAKSRQPKITGVGWVNEKQEIWRPGQTVTLDDNFLRTEGKWLIANISLTQNAGGSTCSLTIADPVAFDRLAEPEKAKKRKKNDDEDDDE